MNGDVKIILSTSKITSDKQEFNRKCIFLFTGSFCRMHMALGFLAVWCHCFCIPLIRLFLSSDTADHFRRPHNAQTASRKSISTILADTPLLSSRIRVTSGDTQGRRLDIHDA